MSRATAWTMHIAVLLMGGSGVLLFWMIYCAAPSVATGDEVFAVQHPWQPLATAAHILGAPLLVFVLGLVWYSHVWPRVRSGHRPRRCTGVLVALLAAPLTLGGYALQVVEAETARAVLGWTHVAAGMTFALGYLLHQWAWFARRTDRESDPLAP